MLSQPGRASKPGQSGRARQCGWTGWLAAPLLCSAARAALHIATHLLLYQATDAKFKFILKSDSWTPILGNRKTLVGRWTAGLQW